MNGNDRLFSSTDCFAVSETRKKATRDEISELDPDQLLNTSVETAVQYFVDRNAIEAPALDRENLVIENRETSRVADDYGRLVCSAKVRPMSELGPAVQLPGMSRSMCECQPDA